MLRLTLVVTIAVAACAAPQPQLRADAASADTLPPQFPCVPDGGDGCAAAKIYAQATCFHAALCGSTKDAQQCAVDVVAAYCELTDCAAPYLGDFATLDACADAVGRAACPDLGPSCLVTP